MRPNSPLLYIKQPPNPYIERPVILGDNELNTPEPVPKATTVAFSVDTGANPASELSKEL
jgi:hypothetical protein